MPIFNLRSTLAFFLLVASVSSSPPYAWAPLGCYNDFGSDSQRALDGAPEWWPSSMTVEACNTYCTGYVYSGIEYGGQCFCGNTILTYGPPNYVGTLATDSGSCYMPCTGNDAETCGAANFINIYVYDGPIDTNPVVSSSIDVYNPIASSTVGLYDSGISSTVDDYNLIASSAVDVQSLIASTSIDISSPMSSSNIMDYDQVVSTTVNVYNTTPPNIMATSSTDSFDFSGQLIPATTAGSTAALDVDSQVVLGTSTTSSIVSLYAYSDIARSDRIFSIRLLPSTTFPSFVSVNPAITSNIRGLSSTPPILSTFPPRLTSIVASTLRSDSSNSLLVNPIPTLSVATSSPTSTILPALQSNSLSLSTVVSTMTADASVLSSAQEYTITTVYTTTEYTITSCAPTVWNCPGKIGSITTKTIALYTTICPVTATETSISAQPTATIAVPTSSYTIQAGDTFNSIAAKFGITVASLEAANPNAIPTDLQIGSIITIPSSYTIQAGDTLNSIAAEYGISVASLEAANPDAVPTDLQIGEIVIIPTTPQPVPMSVRGIFARLTSPMAESSGRRLIPPISRLFRLLELNKWTATKRD